ncbi:MAG TPA: hypothetical protein VEI49_13030 [Terriglobales bacterium]|nr:hypothetical protein [Terriglobales bacterium]
MEITTYNKHHSALAPDWVADGFYLCDGSGIAIRPFFTVTAGSITVIYVSFAAPLND